MPHTDNLLTYNAIALEYVRSNLLLQKGNCSSYCVSKLKDMDVLDLGVGAGRTSFTFAALVRTYIGIDYAPAMVEICRSRFGENDRQKFLCLDAADLSTFDDQKFDLVLFSFNGIDTVELKQRRKILQEVHRLLKPDGYFFFSGHSLDAFPWPIEWPRFRLTRPLRSMVCACQEGNLERSLAAGPIGDKRHRRTQKARLGLSPRRGAQLWPYSLLCDSQISDTRASRAWLRDRVLFRTRRPQTRRNRNCARLLEFISYVERHR